MTSPAAHSGFEDDVALEKGAYFPRSYLTELYRLLSERRDLFEVMTYADLDWVAGDDPARSYPLEHERWTASLKDGRRDPTKIHVLIQYDVDSVPERSMGLLRDPAHRGIRANIMIFNRRIDRRLLSRTGELAYTPYPLDEELLRQAESEGSVIGYHINAHEQAVFDMARAQEIVREDIQALRKRFSIRYVSAHGGAASPKGRNNHDIPYDAGLQQDVIWVHNGRSPRFHGSFSDGGHNKSPDPAKRDLRDFVRNMRPGRRYRILLHPQYYDATARPSQRFSGTPWYDAVLSASAAGKAGHWAETAAAAPFTVNTAPPQPAMSTAAIAAPARQGMLRRLIGLAGGRPV
jgi:hypothetical protein